MSTLLQRLAAVPFRSMANSFRSTAIPWRTAAIPSRPRTSLARHRTTAVLYAAALAIAANTLTTATAAASAAAGSGPVAHVEVDARDASRGIERVHMTLPVKPGRLTLLYPKWLPGEHAPTGPIGGLAGLKFSARGTAIAWQRDADNMFAFHLTVPRGVDALDIEFEIDAVPEASDNNAARLSTDALAIVLWNELVLYPAGVQSDDLRVSATLRVPDGWQLATALPEIRTGLTTSATAAPAIRADGSATQYAPVSLTTLIDSPVLAGRYFRTVELGGTPAAYLHIAADSAAALAITQETTAQLRKLVQETTALFGATHYDDYHFLLTLSDRIGYEGIEHHQSSDNRMAERALIDDDLRHSSSMATLLSHEYVHSWNGKYRRPVGLATGNYDAPMRGELLWVYEGLTEYLGMVLSARSGLAPAADARDEWANVAAWLQTRQGRDWRPLADTAIAAQIGYTQAREWRARTRATDFYDESAMLWLEADTLIRAKTHGAKSLDDFCRLFYGPPSTAPMVTPYGFDDVMRALNTVLPFDWRGFWTERLNRLRATAPLEGLSASGWSLTYAPEPSTEQKGDAAFTHKANLYYSLGFMLNDDSAVISEILPGSPADSAAIVPDSMLIAVDGRKYSKDVLDDALKASAENPSIALLLQNQDRFRSVEIRYAGGIRYPRLQRNEGTADLLTPIMAARTP